MNPKEIAIPRGLTRHLPRGDGPHLIREIRSVGISSTTAKLVLAAVAFLAASQPAAAATANATVKASVVKPLVMTGGGTINLGTIVTPSSASFSGTFTIQPTATQTGTYCAAGFACSGVPAAAMFNLQGTNKTDINLTIPLSVTMTMVGYTGGGATPTLTLTTRNSVATNNATGIYVMQLPNSGFPGTDFYVGGSVTIDQATVGGSYQGTFTVTADYL